VAPPEGATACASLARRSCLPGFLRTCHQPCICPTVGSPPLHPPAGAEDTALFCSHYRVKQGGNCDLSARSDPHEEFADLNVLIERQVGQPRRQPLPPTGLSHQSWGLCGHHLVSLLSRAEPGGHRCGGGQERGGGGRGAGGQPREAVPSTGEAPAPAPRRQGALPRWAGHLCPAETACRASAAGLGGVPLLPACLLQPHPLFCALQIVPAWNGMAISAYALASRILTHERPPAQRRFPAEGRPPADYLQAALKVRRSGPSARSARAAVCLFFCWAARAEGQQGGAALPWRGP
jgi:hypothetical protein